jgi:hypothetical protein
MFVSADGVSGKDDGLAVSAPSSSALAAYRSAVTRQYSASVRMLIRRANSKYSSACERKYCTSAMANSGSSVFDVLDI